MLKTKDRFWDTQYDMDQYDPDLDMTALDAILDGGAPPSHVVDQAALIPELWKLPLIIFILVFTAAAFAWAFRLDYQIMRDE